MNFPPPPSDFITLAQQAETLQAQGDYDRAASLYEELIALEPDVKLPYWQLGLICLLQGNESEAQLIWMSVLAEAEPDQLKAWTTELVELLTAEADRQEASADLKMAWLMRKYGQEFVPDDVTNLLHSVRLSLQLDQCSGEELVELGLIDLLQTEAVVIDTDLLFEVARSLLDTMPNQPPVVDFIAACLPHVDDPPAWISLLLATATQIVRLFDTNALACQYIEFCLDLDPHHSEALLRLSVAYQEVFRYSEAIELARRYCAGCQTPIQKLMGNAVLLRGLMSTGAQWQEADNTLRQGTLLLQAFLESYHPSPEFFLDASILCTPPFFYPYLTDEPEKNRPLQNRLAQVYQESVHAQVALQAKEYQPYPIAPFVRSRQQKKIRVGYLSRCMRMHSVGWLSRWIFEHFDRDRFELFAYFNQQAQIDSFSKYWFADKATRACCFTGDNLGIAQAIREDEVDILVDLDSITSDYSCAVLALKPAPVQVTWLGLDASGLPSIDYFIADPYVLPASAQDYYSEQIWRLPQTYLAVDGFEVGIPTLRRDWLGIPDNAVIYFSAQFAYKRYPQTVRLQMQILRQVPNSYFLIKGLGDEQAIQSLFYQIAEEEGVGRDRLRFLPRDDSEYTHRANLGIADVVLDTFPYNGATTTMETLWMGIPIVTQVGQQFASRNSYGMMMNAGIHEGIADTEAEYVEWGVRLGQDAALRRAVAWKLKQSRQTSPLWNAKQFTRELEKAYEQMWNRFLES